MAKTAAVKKKAATPEAGPVTTERAKIMATSAVSWVDPLDIVVREGFNVRQDMGDIPGLVESVTSVGVKVPLLGYVIPEGEPDAGKFAITDGERRYRASMIVRKTRDKMLIPIILEEAGQFTDIDRVLDMLVTNMGRKLNMVEEADGVKRLMDAGWKPKAIAEAIGKTEQHISDCRVLTGASDALRSMIRNGVVAATQAIQVIKDHDHDMTKAEGALMKAQVRAGAGNRITAKHVEKNKAKGEPKRTVADLKDIREELEAAKVEKRGNRLRTFDLLVDWLDGKITNKKLIAEFYIDWKAPA